MPNGIVFFPRSTIELEVFPAYASLASYLRDDYSRHVRSSEGLWSLPGGELLYADTLEFYTSVKRVKVC